MTHPRPPNKILEGHHLRIHLGPLRTEKPPYQPRNPVLRERIPGLKKKGDRWLNFCETVKDFLGTKHKAMAKTTHVVNSSVYIAKNKNMCRYISNRPAIIHDKI